MVLDQKPLLQREQVVGSSLGLFGIAFGVIFKVLLRILLECSFVYLFMAPETWLPAPKAPGKKGCSQTEV